MSTGERKALRLPRNLHFDVHKALRLPQKLHFEVYKVLRLPRNLHRGSQSAVPVLVTKSAHQGSQSAAPVTKSARRGSLSAAPATKSALRGFEVDKVLRLPRNLQTIHMCKSYDSLHLSRNQSASKIDHHHVQSTTLSMKSALRSKTAPIPCTCHEKSTLDHQSTRLPSRLPRKVTTVCENAHGTTTRAQLGQAPAVATQISRACAVEMHVDDFERHECTVNSSELAAHARAAHSI